MTEQEKEREREWPLEFKNAVERDMIIRANEFKIRLLREEAIKAGGADCIVLLLDLTDPHAKMVNDRIEARNDFKRFGQPERPGDTLQLVCTDYRPIREIFSTSHQRVFDDCPDDCVRTALLSQGRTLAGIIPLNQKWEETSILLSVKR
jgi:hypothetical protein